MSHKCQAIIVHCIDFRLQKSLSQYLDHSHLLGDCDVLSVAGGVKDLDFVFDQISLSKKLHNISEVFLVNHTDCGAYGGRQAFDSDSAERSAHEKDLNQAKNKLSQAFPDINVHILLAKINKNDNVEVEELTK